MSRSAVELDFFGLANQKSSSAYSSASHSPPVPYKSSDRRRNFRGIQHTISRINPELLKSVIAGSSNSAPSTPTVDRFNPPPSLPICVPNNIAEAESCSKEPPLLTIFFNGTVSVFNVPRDKAESIMKAAMEGTSDESVSMEIVGGLSVGNHHHQLVGPLTGDLPLFRRKSLQRFLEKRKARLNCFSPYSRNCS